MSVHQSSPSAPVLPLGVKTGANPGSHSTTPRASWRSKDSARTWIAGHHSPHKAPPLEPVLTTVPATRTSSISGHAEQSLLFQGEDHVMGDNDIKAFEPIAGSARVDDHRHGANEAKRSVVGNVVDGLKLLPTIVLGGCALDRDRPQKIVNTADMGGSTTQEVTTASTQGSAEIEYLQVPDVFVSSSAPTRMKNPPSPHIYDLRNYHRPTGGDGTHQLNTYSHDYYFDGTHPYDWQGTAMSRTGPGYSNEAYSSPVRGNTYLNHDIFSADLQDASSPRHVPHASSHLSAQTESSPQNTLRPPKRRKFMFYHFLKSLYRLPWSSSRIVADYEPRGAHDSLRPTPATSSSWYIRRRHPLDLLSPGASPPTTSIHNHARTPIPDDVTHNSTTRTITDHRRGKSKGNPHATGSKNPPPSRKKRLRNAQSPTEKGVGSQSHKARSKAFSHTLAAVPFPFAPPLLLVTPLGTPHSSNSRVEMRQAMPVYVLTPHSTGTIPLVPVIAQPRPDGISEPPRHPTSISSRSPEIGHDTPASP